MADNLIPRDHHIRAVVDHFLDPPCPPAACVPAGTRAYRFAVAADGHAFLSAWTAAGLARASLLPGGAGAGPGRLRVTLEEWHRQAWAAAPFLGGGDRERLRALFRPEAFGQAERESRCWLGGVELVPPRFAGRSPASEVGPVCAWINLGGLAGRSLAALEAAHAWDGGSLFDDGVDGLVWCVRAEEAGTLGGAYVLGRLAAALRPRQLKILVYADDAPATDGPALPRDRWQALAALAAPAATIELLAEVRDPRHAGGGTTCPFARLAASLALGAEGARRAGAAAREACA
ncbi:MAG: hypothetical protein ACYDIE_08980 [Candidatus Krumholzibacteriia bacterium]